MIQLYLIGYLNFSLPGGAFLQATKQFRSWELEEALFWMQLKDSKGNDIYSAPSEDFM